ncbi:MAG TPA: UvrD-helicase domain-containing protein [Acidimicrobiia bacterium]|nr:UvrD-helicase domain-containing protein [Acidimicrobiia bacterium]
MSAVQQSFDELDEDLATRNAIVGALDETLFVEAGAGSGKTKALVDRIVALVVERDVPMREIAAVTFTEKAAAELRDRIRRALEVVARDGKPVAVARATLALEELDAAAVSTLHAFAQRMLAGHPVEAGLPPRVQVLDDIASQLAFEERWTRFVDELLDDPALERTILLALNADTTLAVLRTLALACNANWDLVAERMHEEPDPPPLGASLAPVLAALDAIPGLAAHCLADDDKLLAGLQRLTSWHTELLTAPDEYEALRLLNQGAPKVGATLGKKDNWPSDCPVDAVRQQVKALRELVDTTAARLTEAVVRRLAWELAQFTLREAGARRAAGELEFHDLLVLARSMLRDPEHGWEVRQRLRSRYTRLLLDEFQDTDPIQCDLAALLASGEPDARAHRWDELAVDPGRLFVVGDPKQSIYRFRRADIAAFLRARSAFGASPRHLTRNFRTARPVIDVVNAIFRELIVAEPESQPEYVALEPVRDPAPVGPAVVFLGTEPREDVSTADALRELEAADVAAVVRRALREGWSVVRRDAAGNEHVEPCRLGDVCILLPARTSLGQLEDALDAAHIPYRAETSSLVYSTREIRDLLVVLQAVDDPTDELALVSALRSPIFGCGDDDLYSFKVEHGGRWDHQLPPPDTLPVDHPVAEAMRALAAWHDARYWSSPSELLDQIVRERRVLEVGFAHGRPRDLWRRVRFVVEQARAFSDAKGGSVRDFLAWADLQGSEGARVVETVLPETDDDAVRILTIHGAKGLEFPITVVSGMTTKAAGRRPGVELVFPHDRDTYAVRVSKRVTTEEFERYAPIDEQMDFQEKLRLLYVAMTRARDHLVVSVHRPAKQPGDDTTKWTHAELVWHAAAEQPGWEAFVARPDDLVALDRGDGSIGAPAPSPPPWDDWLLARDRARDASSRPRVRSATALAREATQAAEVGRADPGLAKGPRDLELPPWNKGRYGTALGRAVHAVLQTIDLATGAGLDDASAAQAAAEGIVGKEHEVAARARVALTTRVVQEAVAHGFRREMYVATPVDGITLEGYVDLVYRGPDGLVVVDYKTDAWSNDADLDTKVARYRLQGASYAVALEQATGETVAECVFVFLGDRDAPERAVSDLPAAMREVRAALAGSSATATTPARPRSDR